jgi:2,3,4,5-tetrahydropyridine-2-carboxylate N-succinyltransferase
MADLQSQIEELWERRASLSSADADAFEVVRAAIDLLDAGEARVATVAADGSGTVEVHQWLKQAVLLLFRLTDMQTIELGPFEYHD